MKIVHSPDMVAHLWANQSQDTARNSGQNFYFTGPALYSYGSHFVIAAHLEDGRILWNDAHYSNSTNRHQTHARRALTTAQWQNAFHVPALNVDTFRNLERLRESGNGGQLPTLAQICADRIIMTVESMANMRLGAGTMAAAFNTAKGLESTADALRAYVAKGKRIPAWSLPRLPDAEPADKASMQAFIKSIAAARLMAKHDANISLARQRLADIAAAIEDSNGWQLQNVRAKLGAIERLMSEAMRGYETAKGKKSAKVRAVLKDLAAIEPAAMAAVTAWEAEQARAEIRMTARDIFAMFRQRGSRSPAIKTGYRSRRDSGYYFNKFDTALRQLPESEAAQYSAVLARLARCNEWDIAANALESAQSEIETAESFLPGHPGDAMSYYKQARTHARQATGYAPFEAFHADTIRGIIETASATIERLRAEIAAKHARAIPDWQAGMLSRLPQEAGTFARIRGDVVETSRGAIVPIAHACRLARIARRVIAAGGKAWPDGSGPMVGSFRVQSIGADGATVIGCHEFDAAESLRVLALLESCEHCAKVSADSELSAV